MDTPSKIAYTVTADSTGGRAGTSSVPALGITHIMRAPKELGGPGEVVVAAVGEVLVAQVLRRGGTAGAAVRGGVSAQGGQGGGGVFHGCPMGKATQCRYAARLKCGHVLAFFHPRIACRP